MHPLSKASMLTFAFAAAMALSSPNRAAACDDRPCGLHNGPCADDVKTLCPDASSHQDARQCLREHADQVSPACAEKMEARRQRHAAVRNACAADLAALCPDAQGRDMRHCLHEHRGELSSPCVETLQSLHQHCSEQSAG